MQQQAVFFRNETLGTQIQTLPAPIYNAMRQLIRLQNEARVFLPIRSLQSIAVICADEVMFVDIHMRKVVEFSWQNFRPQDRSGIDSPVDYHFVWHNQRAFKAMDMAPDELMRVMIQRIKSIKDMDLESRQIGKLLQLSDLEKTTID